MGQPLALYTTFTILPPLILIFQASFIDDATTNINKNNFKSCTFINNRSDKIVYTNKQIDELHQIASQFFDNLINTE